MGRGVSTGAHRGGREFPCGLARRGQITPLEAEKLPQPRWVSAFVMALKPRVGRLGDQPWAGGRGPFGAEAAFRDGTFCRL